jgi:hypothetical protein
MPLVDLLKVDLFCAMEEGLEVAFRWCISLLKLNAVKRLLWKRVVERKSVAGAPRLPCFSLMFVVFLCSGCCSRAENGCLSEGYRCHTEDRRRFV